MKVLLRNQNSHELFLLGLQEIARLGYSGNPSRSVNCAVDFLRLPHPLNLKKKIGVGCFLEDLSAVASVLGLILFHVLG